MVSFLFWNLNQKPLESAISNLATHYLIDVLMLVESSISPGKMLTMLNHKNTSFHYSPSIGCEKVEVFARFINQFVRPVYETDRLTVRHLCLPGTIDLLLAIVHFPSKLHWDESSQMMECVELSNSIKEAEAQIGHSNTILVGDLNMNPFENGMVSANGLHAVMTKRIAEKRKRIVQSKAFPFFHNPMWSLFGDMTPGPPGTYFYSTSAHRVFFWNIFDKVLIRPNLLARFDTESLRVLESDGVISLLSSNGSPDRNNASDHLPLFFKLEI
jgi:hypothetical protein